MKWPAAHPLQLVLGPALWLLWFGIAYGGLSVACSVAPPPPAQGLSGVNLALLLLTLVTTAALAWAAVATGRAAARLPRAERFVPRVGAFLHAISAVSTLVVGLPLAVLPPCV